MDSFENALLPFNPQLYGSNNIPLPTDKLNSFRGYTAGLMTAAGNQPTGPPKVAQTTVPNENDAGSSSNGSNLNLHSKTPLPMLSAPVTGTKNHNLDERYSGMYAASGLDILSILSRVVNRPNPQIDLGPVDLSSSIVVVDARQYDFPVIYASPMFERLTGYAPYEVIGRNCRFLQAPDGCVAMGSCRRYTDNSTVHHIKSHMIHGKESQSSIINYRKSGQPFVNLLTVIPISFDAEEIIYFVGFQVDMVEQPNTIIQNMKDGTYMVNYQQQMTFPSHLNPSTCGSLHQNQNPSVVKQEWVRPASECPPPSPSLPEPKEEVVPIEAFIKEAMYGDRNPQSRRLFEELLLEQYPDFMHVLTIKGLFLYCSNSVRDLLEYEPSELENKSLKTVCHPSDLTTVLRELKQCSNGPMEYVNMIYRIRRKKSGYMWIECTGKLHNEDGRGRKYIVLSGRERSVYHLTSHAIMLGRRLQGIHMQGAADDHEVWCKLDLDGLILYASWNCANILGYTPTDIIGVSIYEFLQNDTDTINVTRALAEVREGKVVNLQHTVISSMGMEILVQSNLYPDGVTTIPKENPSFVILQMRTTDQDLRESRETMLKSIDLDAKKKGRSSSSDPSLAGSMDKKIGMAAEKMFRELNIECDTNWQYELHQLRINNNKLRDEFDQTLNRLKKNTPGVPQDIVCGNCLRRIACADDAIELNQENSPVLCNSCILMKSLRSSTLEA